MKIPHILKLTAAAPESPPAMEPPAATAKSKRFGKKLYAALAVIAIIIIAAAFFIPQVTTATIPLKVDYVVGEKMVYDSTITVNLDSFSLGLNLNQPTQAPNSTTINSQQTIEVTGFDGENYLLNHTYTMTVLNRPFSFSMMEKMNKTGYSTYLLNLGNSQTEISTSGITGDSFLAQLLNQPEVKVGDTISVPYPSISPTIQTTGNLTIKFNGAEDLTVPAGTYRVFRIDITSNNLQMTLNPPQADSSLIPTSALSMSMDINFQMYLEYGTMRQIKSTMQETSSYQSSILNMTMGMTEEMTLTQHTRP